MHTSLRNLPLARPQPDAERFISILMGRAHGERTPLVEYIVDDVVMEPIVVELLGRRWVGWGTDRESQRAYLDNFTCGERGRYAVGSGNSIPSYVPVENYLAMVDEALDQ